MIKVSELKLGDTIRCFDFEPRFMAADRFVDGHIIEITENAIQVDVVFDSVFCDKNGKGGRSEIRTPTAMVIGEWNGRLQLCRGMGFSTIDTVGWLNGGPVEDGEALLVDANEDIS
jgi:hypothetical protein